tara:strand:+ start:416 stop:1162 length:747 start_codon:yes stop_codon:yes gene_type:complete
MSSISAGTTSGTALVSTGDTTGNLVLKTNTNTDALTLNTSGAIGVGTTPSYGTAGQVLTSGGSAAAPTWGAAGGSLIFITSLTASNSATIDLEGIDSTYKNYVIYGSNITNASGSGNPQLVCRTKINGSYQTTNYIYQSFYNDNTAVQNSGNTTWQNQASQGTTSLYVLRLTNENSSFQMTIPNPSSTTQYKPITSTGQGISGSSTIWQHQTFGMCVTGQQALTGMRFFIVGDNLLTGTFSLYGIKNS